MTPPHRRCIAAVTVTQNCQADLLFCVTATMVLQLGERYSSWHWGLSKHRQTGILLGDYWVTTG